MTLRLADHWVWDAWYAVDRGVVHVFYLHAPRALGDPDRRHHAARVGHAVSSNLVDWEVLPPALGPGRAGAFDDLATWTGSVIRDGEGWLMAYTGISRVDRGTIQRIGFARSQDLKTWARVGDLIEADPRWYETDLVEGEVHWRDPWLWRDADGALHAFVTARANTGPPDGRGVIGHLRDGGGLRFEVLPPVSAPGEMRQLEVTQLLELAPDLWVVLACARAADASARRRARPGHVPQTGTFVLEGTSPVGPFQMADGPFLDGHPTPRSYAGRVVGLDGRQWLMSWMDTVDGQFVGELADPVLLEVDGEGRLRLAGEPA